MSSAVSIAIEIVCLLVTLVLLYCVLADEKRSLPVNRIFTAMLSANALLLLVDLPAWYFDGAAGYDALLLADVIIGYAISYIETCLLSHYIACCISHKSAALRRFVRAADCLTALAVALLLTFSLNKAYFYYEDGVYRRGSLYGMSQVIPLCILAANELVVLMNRKRLGVRYTVSLLSYGLLPAAAMLIQPYLTHTEITYTMPTLALLIVHVTVNTERSRLLVQREAELEKAKISLMLSQIKPHFLYNTLSTIGYLCEQNPAAANEMVTTFSKYLRYNMDSVTRESLIPFERELEHIEKYLLLEKFRYGEKLRLEYDISEKSFMLPMLTVQPLVENAVKHGVGGKKGGGTVAIRSFSDKDYFTVTVSDDGVGFDVCCAPELGAHSGISNSKARLKLQCRGTLDIESTIGEGTRATVRIPRRV